MKSIIVTLTKNGRAYTDHCRPFFNRHLKIVCHSHRQVFKLYGSAIEMHMLVPKFFQEFKLFTHYIFIIRECCHSHQAANVRKLDRKITRLNSSHFGENRMPASARKKKK